MVCAWWGEIPELEGPSQWEYNREWAMVHEASGPGAGVLPSWSSHAGSQAEEQVGTAPLMLQKGPLSRRRSEDSLEGSQPL